MLRRALGSVDRARKLAPSLDVSVYVLVNGDDPDAREILRGSPCRPFAFELSEPVSPAQARNLVLRSVREEWVFFLDDDAYLPDEGLAEFERERARWPRAAAFGGPNLTPPSAPVFEQAIGRALSCRLATWFSVSRYRKQGTDRKCGEESLMLCNLFVRRSELDSDPFPASFVCAEENWLLQTLSRKGSTLVHSPGLAVLHDRRPSWPTLAKQVFRYGFGRGQNLCLRPTTARLGYFIPTFCVVSAPLFLARGEWRPFAAYALLCLIGGWTVRSLRAVPIFPLIHVSYGFGLIAGLAGGIVSARERKSAGALGAESAVGAR